jgi:hypothetical protein
LGRAIRRLVSCYDPIISIVNEADRRTIFAAAEDEADILRSPTTEEEIELAREYVDSTSHNTHSDFSHRQDRRFAAFKLLLKVAPQITELSKLSELEKLDAYVSDVRLKLLNILRYSNVFTATGRC